MRLTTLLRRTAPLALLSAAALAQAPAPVPAPPPTPPTAQASAPVPRDIDVTKLVTVRLGELKTDMLPVVVTDAYCESGFNICWMELRTKRWTHKLLATNAQPLTGMRLVVARDAALVQTVGDILITYYPLPKGDGR